MLCIGIVKFQIQSVIGALCDKSEAVITVCSCGLLSEYADTEAQAHPVSVQDLSHLSVSYTVVM